MWQLIGTDAVCSQGGTKSDVRCKTSGEPGGQAGSVKFDARQAVDAVKVVLLLVLPQASFSLALGISGQLVAVPLERIKWHAVAAAIARTVATDTDDRAHARLLGKECQQ